MEKRNTSSRRPASAPTLITDPTTSRRLGLVRQRDTRPETLVRKILHSKGVRFRVRNRDLPGSPDIANRRRKWAIFVHGCFWHRHHGCAKATIPKRNRAFWLAKFDANIARDRLALSRLAEVGYTTVVIWECELGYDMRERLRPIYRASLLGVILGFLFLGQNLPVDPSLVSLLL